MERNGTVGTAEMTTSRISEYFRFTERKTTAGTEVIAGLVTFMTMSYIIFVNPSILAGAGIPRESAMVATCLAAGIATLLMGLLTNYPFALAPGMGLNAFLTYGVVTAMNIPWQVAMGIVFVEGIIILVLVLTNLREAVMNAMPLALKRAVGGGIGIFIAFIGLQSSGIVVKNPATLVAFGGFSRPVLVSSFGLLLTALLMSKRIRGAILTGILATTAVAIAAGIAKMPDAVVALPSADHFETIGAPLRAASLFNVFEPGLIAVIFTFLLTDFFDTMGTVVAVGGEAGFLDRSGRLPGLRNVLLVDSIAAALGGAFGCSSVTTYIESASGVSEGGRTGLASVVTALLFFLSIFFWPLVGIVPAAATAPALIMVGFLMMQIVGEIEWKDFTEAFPAFLTILTIPLTYSISRGIGFGFISYVAVKTFAGRGREVHVLMYIIALLFAADFALSGTH